MQQASAIHAAIPAEFYEKGVMRKDYSLYGPAI
jgi:hypothetical protein